MNNLQKIRRRATLLALSVTLAAAAARADSARQIQSFDNNWRFLKSDAPGADTPAFDDSAWTKLSLPHDWAIDGPFLANAPTRGSGGFAPSGVVWYRKSFPTPQGADKRTFVDFDAVMQNSDVYINGFHLGHRPYGYISFQYELTGHLNTDGKPNILAVRADTTQQPASRWYAGGGIYRHVRLETTDPVHIDNWGTFVTTPKVSAAAATVHVRSTVINQSAAPRDVTLQVGILGPDGQSVYSGETAPQSVPAGKSVDFDQDITINNPKLWSLENPALYSATASIRAGTQTIDDQSVPIGIRNAEFRSDTGFWLNGKNFKLKGVCMHADAGGLGMAVPEDEWIHRLQALKQFGANAVRTAHNPPSPEFLDACDRLGMLVMDENFDCWDVAKNPFDYHLYFDQWSLIDTRDQVRRDRNHPSIILYSAGNEIHDTPNPAKAIPILQGLVKTFHENDPTRPVTQALFRPNSDGNGGAYKNGLADLLDVVGTNYRDQELIDAQKAKPSIKIVGTENNKPESAWAIMRDTPSYSGSFIWTGVDYLGETMAYPSIGAGAGYLDITDRPKAEAYERGSWWSDTPVVYIARAAGGNGGGAGRGAPGAAPGAAPGGAGAEGGGGGADAGDLLSGGASVFVAAPGGGRGGARGGRGAAPGGAPAAGRGARGGSAVDWSPANRDPHPETIDVNSNCDEVELFLNDKSLGSKPRGKLDSVRTWQVEFAPGTLKAVGKNAGQPVANFELATAGPASQVTLQPSTQKLFADFDSLAIITVNIADAKGTLVPGATNNVSFKLTGPGEIAALATAPAVAQNFHGTEHATSNGQLTAYIRATGATGPITLTATAEGLAPATTTFETALARSGH